MASSSTNPYPNDPSRHYRYPSEFNVSGLVPDKLSKSDYPYPSEFNVRDLVPDKLSKSNYSEWKPLMLDFIESRGMNEFIHDSDEDIEDFNDPKKDIEDPYFDDYEDGSWRKSDGLVRTWILSTLNKDIVKQVLPYKSARAVWMALETMLGSRNAQQPGSSLIEAEAIAQEKLHSYLPLHIAAIQGDVQSAKNFIRSHQGAISEPISTEGETVLITAVRSVRRNELVKYLLPSSRDSRILGGSEIPLGLLRLSDNLGRTALHEAAEVGNLEAAKMLVDHDCDLLIIEDEKKQTPLICAAKTGNREMVRFLLDQARARAEAKDRDKAEAEFVARARVEAEFMARARAEARTEAEARAWAEADVRAWAEARAGAEADDRARARARAGAGAGAWARARAGAEAKARARVEAKSRARVEAERLGFSETERVPPTLLYHLANSGLCDIALELLQQNSSMLACTDTSTGSETCPLMAMSQKRSSFRSGTPLNSFHKFIYSIAPAKLRNNATKNPAEHCEGNTENSANRENPDENIQRPIDTENLANTENPVENLQSHTENPANRENPQNLPQNLVVNENQQNPPAATDTENSVVDENPQYGAVTENPPIIENNLQNPVNIADSENPQNCTITENLTVTENPIVNENPQIINENSQNLIVTDNSIVNENPQTRIDITEDSALSRDSDPQYGGTPTSTRGFNEWVKVTPSTHGCPTHFCVNNDNLVKIGNGWNLVVDKIGNGWNLVVDKIGNGWNLVVNGIGRWHAIHWHLADQYVPANNHIREIKLKHHEALELVKCLCKEIAKLDYSTVACMFPLALARATSSGIHEIVEEILRSYPDAIYFKNENNQSIFQSAIVWRRENVFNLIYQLDKECSHKFLSVPDKFGNNALHLAGCLGPQQHLSVRVSAAGAALQMQRELQWFKEVEKFVLPHDKECRNDDEMTPAEVFTKTHEELVEAGERWMKDTATSCTIVAALIATVMFAAAITVPGGNNASSGVSIFSKRKAFVIFGLSDALALFASIASLLMFLSILTARYAEEDFLYSLPNRLIIGLVNLFLSISSTMTAFSATLYLMFGENRRWILYPIVAFACIPSTLFVFLLFPLLVVMYKSTYHPAIFGKQSDHMLF